MTRDEAEARARELAADDGTHSYFARERDGEWGVVRIPAPGGRAKPLGTATEARPRPEAADPRPPVPPHIAGF